MINLDEQQNIFMRIAEKLPKRIEVYAIGGTAMMFLGLKDKTLDLDIVFLNATDRKIFKDTAKLLDFEDTSAEIVYGKRDNAPEMVKISDVRLDLFLFKIISSYFSTGMQKRAMQTHDFIGKLIIRIASPSDILVMKSATARQKDDEDIISIIKENKANWEIIVKESEEQVMLGNESAVLSLGTRFERLKNEKKVEIPKEVLDKLWKILKKQTGKNKLKSL